MMLRKVLHNVENAPKMCEFAYVFVLFGECTHKNMLDVLEVHHRCGNLFGCSGVGMGGRGNGICVFARTSQMCDFA